MFDILDIFALVVIAVLVAAVVVVVVSLGSLPGSIAQKRCHPQATAISVTSWLGIATLGLLWPLALIWAFLKPASATVSAKTGPRPATVADGDVQLQQMQARVDALEASLRELHNGKEVR
jgi:hypothetical protein